MRLTVGRPISEELQQIKHRLVEIAEALQKAGNDFAWAATLNAISKIVTVTTFVDMEQLDERRVDLDTRERLARQIEELLENARRRMEDDANVLDAEGERAWECHRCGQRNSAWAAACGRCGRPLA